MRWMAGVVVLVAGCATTGEYERILASYVGHSELELIRNWGPPDTSYTVGDIKFLSYQRGGMAMTPGVAPSYTTTFSGGVARTTPVGGMPAMAVNRVCVSTFEVQNDRIVRWSWRGNACKAVPPANPDLLPKP